MGSVHVVTICEFTSLHAQAAGSAGDGHDVASRTHAAVERARWGIERARWAGQQSQAARERRRGAVARAQGDARAWIGEASGHRRAVHSARVDRSGGRLRAAEHEQQNGDRRSEVRSEASRHRPGRPDHTSSASTGATRQPGDGSQQLRRLPRDSSDRSDERRRSASVPLQPGVGRRRACASPAAGRRVGQSPRGSGDTHERARCERMGGRCKRTRGGGHHRCGDPRACHRPFAWHSEGAEGHRWARSRVI